MTSPGAPAPITTTSTSRSAMTHLPVSDRQSDTLGAVSLRRRGSRPPRRGSAVAPTFRVEARARARAALPPRPICPPRPAPVPPGGEDRRRAAPSPSTRACLPPAPRRARSSARHASRQGLSGIRATMLSAARGRPASSSSTTSSTWNSWTSPTDSAASSAVTTSSSAAAASSLRPRRRRNPASPTNAGSTAAASADSRADSTASPKSTPAASRSPRDSRMVARTKSARYSWRLKPADPDQRVRLLERFLPVACVETKAEDVAAEERRALKVTVLRRARRALDRHVDRPPQVAEGSPGDAEVRVRACRDTAVTDELERPIEQLDGAAVAVLRHARGLGHDRVRLELDVADRPCVLDRSFRLAASGVELEVHHEHPRVLREDERRRAGRRPSVEDGRRTVEQSARVGRARVPRVPARVDGRLCRPLRVARALERVDRPLEVVTGPTRVGKRPSRMEQQLGRRLGVVGEQRQRHSRERTWLRRRRRARAPARPASCNAGTARGPRADDILAGRPSQLDRG